MGDYSVAGAAAAAAGHRREDLSQTVQSPATVQSEDEGYETLLPMVSSVCINLGMYSFMNV